MHLGAISFVSVIETNIRIIRIYCTPCVYSTLKNRYWISILCRMYELVSVSSNEFRATIVTFNTVYYVDNANV